MIRSRAFVSLIVILPMFVVGCASGGIKKPTVFVDQYNSVPADIPSQFLDRYYFLIDKEEKEFKKLLVFFFGRMVDFREIWLGSSCFMESRMLWIQLKVIRSSL